MINEHFHDSTTKLREQLVYFLAFMTVCYLAINLTRRCIVGIHDWLEQRSKQELESRYSLEM
jgi:hypothetical protein